MQNCKTKENFFYITNGVLNKKKIKFLSTENIKPTKGNIKKTLYSHIHKYKNIYLLELFGGTGIISFDTYSNNSKKNILIEKDMKTYQQILSNKNYLIKNNFYLIKFVDKFSYLFLLICFF